MAERSSLNEQIQIGLEVTPGTAVAANKLLQSASISLTPDGGVNVFRAAGSKFPALASLGKEFAGGDIEGQPTYTEMAYFLAGLLGDPVITTPGGATNARLWTWPVSSSAAQDGRAFTIEKGGAVQAERVAGAVITGMGIDYSRDELTLNGDVLAMQFETGITKTVGPTALALVPILPKEIDVFLDTTSGGLGTTKLLRALEASWSLTDRFGPVWPLNSALASYAATFETEPSSEVNLTLEADATGMGLFSVMRLGTTRFLRIQALSGTEIEVGFPYRLRCDFAVKVTEIPDFSDEDGLYAVGWQFGMFADSGWGKAGEITLQTSLTAL